MFDYSLYLVTDRGLARGRSTPDIVRAAIAGGATCVQLREKNRPIREFIEEARALKTILTGVGIPLIINDRVDVALAVNADGVHLGQNDMHIRDARRLAGTSMIIGISVESVHDALHAEAEGADYIGVSPIFVTPTKHDTAPALGLEGLRAIRAAVTLPLVGIGGIHPENTADLIRAGADGVAVVSAIVSAPCPRSAAKALRQQIQSARTKEHAWTNKKNTAGC
ncbi:thiamine phosphate synthase [Desulfobulbus alkaliphilus]|uniref:thiamine phosphate synthase n=1 Tax=Desulfobulbus alkaliphilus TaxID=869814 RepID=UPI001963D791|nr:thiamine phosphate synthase [Desulfobulbus alkaliphilus]MBM9535836.1 thiamine phosphate synthase [Desulfobulbus alkaliphilus]